jgi:hypothetical protein
VSRVLSPPPNKKEEEMEKKISRERERRNFLTLSGREREE